MHCLGELAFRASQGQRQTNHDLDDVALTQDLQNPRHQRCVVAARTDARGNDAHFVGQRQAHAALAVIDSECALITEQ
jgi:hypothetical protein